MNNETVIKERVKVINHLTSQVGHLLGFKRPTNKEVKDMIRVVLEGMGIVPDGDTVEFLTTAHYFYVVNEGDEEVIQKLLERNYFGNKLDFQKTLELINVISKSSNVYCYDMPGGSLVRFKHKVESGEPMYELFEDVTEEMLNKFRGDYNEVTSVDLGSKVMNSLNFYLWQYANDLRNRVTVVEFKKFKELEPRGDYDIYVVPGHKLGITLELSKDSKRYVVSELGYKEIEKANFRGLAVIRNVYVRTDIHF